MRYLFSSSPWHCFCLSWRGYSIHAKRLDEWYEEYEKIDFEGLEIDQNPIGVRRSPCPETLRWSDAVRLPTNTT